MTRIPVLGAAGPDCESERTGRMAERQPAFKESIEA